MDSENILFQEIDFTNEFKDERMKESIKEASREIYKDTQADKIKKPFVDQNFKNFIIVTNLPEVNDQNKFEILRQILINKILVKVELNNKLKSHYYQLDQQGFRGVAIWEFDSKESADKAFAYIDGFKLDKDHILKVYDMESYEKILKMKDQYVELKILSQPELECWNFDQKKRECFFLKIGEKLFVNWFFILEKEPKNFFLNPPELEASQQKYLRKYENEFINLQTITHRTEWSKSGNYLIEYLENGFQLYGGTDLAKLNFYEHPGVLRVEFSNDDKYCISYNGTVISAPNQENFIIWNVIEAEQLRVFQAEQKDEWGTFKFSYDSNYIARIRNHQVVVYQLPEMTMITDEQTKAPAPIIVKNIQKFIWTDKSNMLCCISYAGNLRERDSENTSCKIQLIEVPSRREHKWKNINQNVIDADLVSHENGNWIVAVLKKAKKKQVVSTIVQVANIKRRELIEVADKEIDQKVYSYSIESKHGRLAFSYKEDENQVAAQVKFNLLLYSIEEGKQGIELQEIGKYESKQLHEVLWSPNGIFFALINKDNTSAHQGILELGYLHKDKHLKYKPEINRSYNNVYNMDFAQWDPSGRFIITSSSKLNCFQVWNAYGEQLFKDTIIIKKQLDQQTPISIQLQWRPRPKNLLDDKGEQELVSNYKHYRKHYETEDDKIINRLEHERKERKERMKREFEKFMRSKRREWESSKADRIKLLGFDEEEIIGDETEEIIENELIIQTD